MSMSQSREENIMGLKIYGFDCQNLKNGDNGAMVTNLFKAVLSNTWVSVVRFPNPLADLSQAGTLSIQGPTFCHTKEKQWDHKAIYFFGACDDAGDVDGSTDRVIALDQSSV